MRFGRVKLKGYIGLYNGLDGLLELFIDFRRCRNRITFIRGINGSGKSTLKNALHPMPDSNDNFIAGLEASKELELIDGDTLYSIRIVHPIKTKSDGAVVRGTTEARIRKTTPFSDEELNPNGNITSYKEILADEIGLDANFMALTQLSSSNRGLADKKPSERKHFMNSIIDGLEVYNNIHKSLTKRASIFKSLINGLAIKIDMIGDEENVKNTLISLENRLNDLMRNKDIILEELATNKSTIKLVDPNGLIQQTYQVIYNGINNINNEISIFDNSLKNKLMNAKLPLDIQQSNISIMFQDSNKNINNIESSINVLESRISNLLSDREVEAKELNTKSARLLSLNDNRNILDIENSIKLLRESVLQSEMIFKQIGFINEVTLSKEEYIIGMENLRSTKEMIYTFKSNMKKAVIEEAIFLYGEGRGIDTKAINTSKENLVKSISNIDIEISNFNVLLDVSKKLEMRPSKCKIDTCAFIEDSLIAFRQNPIERINELQIQKNILEIELRELSIYLENSYDVIECLNSLNIVMRSIKMNYGIISKLPNGHNFSESNILDRILRNDSFDDINELLKYIEYCDVFDNYSMCKSNLYILEADYEVYKSRNQLVDEIMNDIDLLSRNLDAIYMEIEGYRETILSNKALLVIEQESGKAYLDIMSTMDSIKLSESNKSELMAQYYNIKDNMSKIEVATNNINSLNYRLSTVTSEITPVINDRDELKHSLRTLETYKAELRELNDKYEKVQTIKYHSSPTTGIQLLFMELYMGKVIQMANGLLSNLFCGKFHLKPFIILEDEFRIPCQGDGLLNDDISSMSTSEVCMISMIISFSLMLHASSRYNIIELDEIDGGLDSFNRRMFLGTAEGVCDILQTEQCIIISHNTEGTIDNADIILLKIGENETITGGNIIYQY